MQTTLPRTNFTIQTEAYQGPFELLLDLIEARKLLVNDLALASITEDFIQHVRAQEAFPVEETANFIQIAATLLLIKSKSLIPDLMLSEEENTDVEDLKRRLAAYEKVREASRELLRIFGKTMMLPAGERLPEPFFAPSHWPECTSWDKYFSPFHPAIQCKSRRWHTALNFAVSKGV